MSGSGFDPATRPSRIPGLGQTVILILIGGSFISGACAWWGQIVQARELSPPSWLHACLVVHGGLNGPLCILFGALLCHHIRIGWVMRANLLTGFVAEAIFAGLIITGVVLYYAGSPDTRTIAKTVHRVMGLAFPLGLAAHWISGVRWARKTEHPSPIGPRTDRS